MMSLRLLSLLFLPTVAISLATETPARQPWEFGRFVKQSSKFVTIPFLPGPSSKSTVIAPGTILWQPSSSSSSSSFSFGPLDDVVMGGASSSTFDDASGTWTGQVTDANNGGFIGIRSFPACQWDMSACQGIELKLRGGKLGKRFKVVLRDSTDFNGICWTTSVDVGGGLPKLFRNVLNRDGNDVTTSTVRVPFDKQIPTIFAKTVPGKSFQKDSVVGVQFAYSKFEYDGELNPMFEVGDVELQILEIKAY